MGIEVMRSRRDPLTKYYLRKNIEKVADQIKKEKEIIITTKYR